MGARQLNTVLHHLRRAAGNGHAPALTDGQLLDSFIHSRDENAFANLVRRHGPMVLGVCRRITGNVHDADDAFQAAFLVLVRKARSVVPREMVGNFLHGVAYHTALKARLRADRRRCKEKKVADMPHPETAPSETESDLLARLDREIHCLPDKYRLPVVLCELEGRSRKEVAAQLHLPEGTLSSRLAKARKLLAERLGGHGAPLGAAAMTGALAGQAAAESNTLVQATVEVAVLTAAGQATAEVVSANILFLTDGVLKTMLLAKLKVVMGTVLVLAGIVCGSTAGWYGSAGAHEQPEGKTEGRRQKAEGRKQEPATAVAFLAKDESPNKDEDLLQGTWRLVGMNFSDREILPVEKKLLESGKRIVQFQGADFLNWEGHEGTYTLDPTSKPKRIKMTVSREGKAYSYLGIYDLKGDDLALCFGNPGDDRYPEEMEVNKAKGGRLLTTMVLKRTEPWEAKSLELDKKLLDKRLVEALVQQQKALDAQLERVKAQQIQLEIERAKIEAQIVQAKAMREAEMARARAMLDAKSAVEKATKGQSNDKALRTLEEIEKLIQQMKKDLKSKQGPK